MPLGQPNKPKGKRVTSSMPGTLRKTIYIPAVGALAPDNNLMRKHILNKLPGKVA